MSRDRSTTSSVRRVDITDAAAEMLRRLEATHGPLLIHQSGGCCDGSSPMCLQQGDFLLGSRDLCLGEIHGCKFYMAADQFEYYRNMHITVDVTSGRGSSFSLEIPLGVRFMAVSRIFRDDELSNIRPIAS